MAIVDLSGTRAVRYPDPTVPRVLPNGIQPYSAYTAIMGYFYSGEFLPEVGNIDQTEAQICQFLLFGTDYPANVMLLQLYNSPLYDENGLSLPIQPLDIPVMARSTDNIAAILPNVAPAVPSVTHYKQIVTGSTLTNGVTVSGFSMAVGVGGNLIYKTEDGNAGDPAPVGFLLTGLFNGAVIASTTFHVALYDPATIRFPNLPVILWEGDFTQQMVDDGFKFTGIYGGADAVFDVVGLWGISGFTPAPAPTFMEGRMAGPQLSPVQQRLERLRAAMGR